MKLLGVFLIITLVCVFHVTADESCDSDNCEEEIQNVWTEDVEEIKAEEEGDEMESRKPVTADNEILELFKKNGVSMTKLQLELLLNHLDKEDDGKVDAQDLENVKTNAEDPLSIVQSVIDSFNRLDKNQDGKLSETELPSQEEDEAVQEVTNLQYMSIVSNLDKSIFDALKPFASLGFMSPAEIKIIVEASVKVFKENDEDSSGGLNMEEYLKQVENKKSPKLDQQQKEAFFGVVDKNSDGEISYSEFQAMLPKGPPGKNLEEIFLKADKNSDGFWSTEEFGEHLKQMVKQTKAREPTESEIEEAFKHLDKDQDGRVSKPEMLDIHKEIENIHEEEAIKGFRQMDLDGNGHLTKDEMQLMASAMQEKAGQKPVDVDLLIEMLDSNKNGLIELEEVKTLVKRMVPQKT